MAILDNPAVRTTAAVFFTGLILGVIIAFLPVMPIPLVLENAVEWLFSTLWAFDFIIPVKTAMVVFTFVIFTEILLATFKLILFVYRLIFKSKP